MVDSLNGSANLDLYRYLATVMMTSIYPEVGTALVEAARYEQERPKVEILLDVLALAVEQREIAELIESLRQRQG